MNDLEEVVDLDEFFKDICSHYPINEVEIKYRGLEYFQLTGVRSAYDDLKYPPAVTEIKIKTQYFGWSYTLASFEFYKKKDNIVKRDLLKLSFIHNFSSGQVFEVIGKYIIHKELKNE